jgi:putative endonuclease
MAEHNILGERGEILALKLLKDKGYKILETNWRHKKDELDIIALDENELVVVEVKTRSSDFFGEPEDAVNEAKMKRMINAAEEYIEQNEIELECRFDIVSIVINKKEKIIRHIKNAFYSSEI